MRFLALLAPLTVLATACASAGRPGPTTRSTETAVLTRVTDTLVVVDTVEVEAAGDADLEMRAARLQLQLLEKEALIADLRDALDAERQEVVRNMAKLQSQANRAEAASGMAEAEIALQELASEAGGAETEEHERGWDLLSQAATEFGRENYGGALYLASETRSVAAAGHARLRGLGGVKLQAGESLFALPVPLVTVSRSNVRVGPGTTHPVAATLEPETNVTGMSYTNEWVRVSFGERQEGWIFHRLVAKEGDRP